MPSAAWTQHPDQLDESRLSVSREEMRNRIEGCTGKKSRERKKGGAAPSRACGARERSFWSTEGTDYLDERLGRLSETVEVPHSSSVSDSSFLRRAFVEATSSIASLLGVSSFEPCLCLGSAIRSEAASSSSVMPRALHNLTAHVVVQVRSRKQRTLSLLATELLGRVICYSNFGRAYNEYKRDVNGQAF